MAASAAPQRVKGRGVADPGLSLSEALAARRLVPSRGGGQGPFLCNAAGCIHRARSVTQLDLHIITHRMDLPLACVAGCGFRTSWEANLAAHKPLCALGRGRPYRQTTVPPRAAPRAAAALPLVRQGAVQPMPAALLIDPVLAEIFRRGPSV